MRKKPGTLGSVIAGAAALSSVGMIRLAVQFLSIPILARLLDPQDYGLASLAMPIIIFSLIIAEAGISASLIRLPEINTRVWHTCFWLMSIGGIALSVLLMAVAPLIASFFDEPKLSAILMTLSPVIFLQTTSLVPSSALQQQKMFSRMVGGEIAAIIAGIGTAILLATAGYGVWALVWQQIVYYTLRTILTWMLSPYRLSVAFSFEESKDHIAFGWNLLCASLVSFISRSLDNLLIGRVLGTAQLGVYTMAFQFARLPYMLVTGPLQGAMYPHLAMWKDDPERLASAFLLTTRILAMLIIPPVALIAAASHSVFTLLLSEKWAVAAPIFSLLAAATANQAVRGVAGTYLMVLGRTDLQKTLSFQFLILWITLLLFTLRYGIFAVAITYTLSELAFSIWALTKILPLIGCTPLSYYKTVICPLLASILAVLLFAIIASTVETGNLGLVLTLGSLALVTIFVAFYAQRADLSVAIEKITATTEKVHCS